MKTTVVVLLGKGFRVLPTGWATAVTCTPDAVVMAMPSPESMPSWWLELCYASPCDCERS